MSYEVFEESRYLGEPIILIRFALNARTYCYTDAEQPVVMNSETYQPVALDHDKISETGTLDKKTMTILLPVSTEISNLFLAYPPSDIVTVKIFATHADDPDGEAKVIWTGRVLGCTRRASVAEFSCQPVTTSMRRNGLRRRYQYGCPYALYSVPCGASKTAATVTATVQSVSGARITLSSSWTSRPKVKYLDGLVEWTNDDGQREVRSVKRVENAGNVLLLSYGATSLQIGTVVSVSLGCNHKSGTPAQPDGDCGPLHSNVQNFGGQERIPTKNPVGFVNQFY